MRGSAHGLMKDDEGESYSLLCVDSLYPQIDTVAKMMGFNL